MKLIGCVPLILLLAQQNYGYMRNAFDYVLRTIEYLGSVESGVFSCVFYDYSSSNTYRNVLGDVLRSPRLSHVAKYVSDGGFDQEMKGYPQNPSLWIIHPGEDPDLWDCESGCKIANYGTLFNPTTKVLIIADNLNRMTRNKVTEKLSAYRYKYVVFIDTICMRTLQCNSMWCLENPYPPKSMYLFEARKNNMTGRALIFVKANNSVPFACNHHWINETARYLYTEAVELPFNCTETGIAYRKCVYAHEAILEQHRADIIFSASYVTDGKVLQWFCALFTNQPFLLTVAIPRDRPLNAAEILLRPFSWPVWILLATALVSSEVAKRFFPKVFRNDPFLMAVCGFERHDLHRAGQLEKIVVISLIVLMFFLSRAFETKIVSMMVSKPSIQRIKTVEDLLQSELKVHVDLVNSQFHKNHSIVGNLTVDGTPMALYETNPGLAILLLIDYVDLLKDATFDFDRKQPFYEILDYQYYELPETYRMSVRNPLLEVFRYMHSILTEAGLMSHWKRQAMDEMRSEYIGHRPRTDVQSEAELGFWDVQPAWVILIAGLTISVVGFAGEHVWSGFSASCFRWKFLRRFVNVFEKVLRKINK